MIETKEFETESKQLLNLMINSIYTNKEIFLRELISNASDAIDKYKYISLNSKGKYPQKDYEINLALDKKARIITISDNGLGMNKDDLINDLGTIAKSGSKDFVTKFAKATKAATDAKKDDAKKDEQKDAELNIIGQFGVGFYSAFMVSKKIDVITKKYDSDKGYKFSSDGVKTYTIEEDNSLKDSGTTIVLYLKDDTDNEDYGNYLEEFTIEDLIKKYSDYIRYPIKMNVTTQKPKLDKDGKEIKDQYDDVVENKTLNSMIPLWKKNKKDVTDEELNSFYKSKFGDYEDPFASLFINVDGVISYNALVYIPSHAPYNLYSENYEKGLYLYSKGIFIKEKCKELVPDYLKFIKGVVDSEDFDLNISREMLQNSPVLRRINDNIEKKVIEKLKDIESTDFNKYVNFYKNFGDHIKFGIYSSYGQKKDLLVDLLVFHSLNSKDDEFITLKQYKDKMVKDQKNIYYVSGKSLDAIKLLPQLEKYRKQGIDVLFLTENIDEFALTMMKDYAKVEFKNITNESSESMSTEEKDKITTLEATNKRIIDDLTESLKGKVDKVTFSTKLVDSPVCITTKDNYSLNMEETLKNDPSNKNNPDMYKATKVLEINPEHELFKAISTLTNDDDIKKYGSILYDEAMLLEGLDVEDKAGFVKNLNELMLKNIKK
jgi:molecular chaperone HtpG